MKHIEVNTILYTKDGRKIGNAIVIHKMRISVEIKTDYANTLVLSLDELKELFYIKKEDLTRDEEIYISENHKYSIQKYKR